MAVGDIVFASVLRKMQLCGYCVLWSDEDFSKKQLQNFCKFFVEHNYEELSEMLDMDEYEADLKAHGVDVPLIVNKMPYRSKLCMMGKVKTRHMGIAIRYMNLSCKCYMLLAIHTLRKHYRFSYDRVLKWAAALSETVSLYGQVNPDGIKMSEEYMQEFIENETGIVICKEGEK